MERLQKILSQAGICSRRKAEELILKGKVLVNGKVASLGDKASFDDNIIVNGKKVLAKEEKVYYLLNKPSKTICTVKDPKGRKTVIDLINDDRKLFPVGRLDWDTTGTLLITNDGELSNKLIHPSYEVLRLYRAKINESLKEKDLKFLNSKNVKLDGIVVEQEVTQVDNKTYVVALKQGSYHHVKRLFELVDKEVIKLTRIEFAGLTHVGSLSHGEYRELKPHEIKKIKLIAKMI